jgi:hypothetical protein
VDEGERVKKEKEKLLTEVARAQSKVNKQVIRKEYAEKARTNADAVARARAYSRVGRAASAYRDADARASRAAGRDAKAAQKNANAVTREAKRELTEMDKDITAHSEQLYQFAMTALEKALPPEASGTEASAYGNEPAPQGVVVVSVWEHHWQHREEEVQSATLKLFSNGHMDAPDSPSTWTKNGSTFILNYGGENVSTCTLSKDGRAYDGRHQKYPVRVWGKLLSGKPLSE